MFTFEFINNLFNVSYQQQLPAKNKPARFVRILLINPLKINVRLVQQHVIRAIPPFFYISSFILTCGLGGGGKMGLLLRPDGPPGPTKTGGNPSPLSIFVPKPELGPEGPFVDSNSL